ncbi:DUF2993 domain-containing protein [Streptomyces sp. NPDC005438]|uniref:LmeA family phospholipid-binding protein n=1 Tax=Streptomyces sp. NPDC005438 TaxID=3156880 RepID=UPI0033BB4C2D
MRAVWTLVVVLAVLAGLAVVADRVAVGIAEDRVAKEIKRSWKLSGDAEVDIKGFPFLTQVASDRLDEVETTLHGMSARAGERDLRLSELDATFHSVRISGDYSSATAERATGSATFSYADLSKAAEDGVRVEYPGAERARENQVRVVVSLSLLGRSVERSVYSEVSVTGENTVRFRADKVPGGSIPGLEQAVRSRTDTSRKLSGLPKGLELSDPKVTKDGVRVAGSGRDISLSQ